MRLTNDKALELLKAPANPDAIRQAQQQEDKLAFHCEPVLERKLLPNSALTSFESWVGGFLPKDKLARFQQLLTLPVDTTESTKAIFDELAKFLDAQDRYIDFEFVSEQIAQDFEDYRNSIEDEQFWRTKGMQALRTGINSLLVVDCPAVQTSLRPEPYYYFVNVHQLRDVLANRDSGLIEYVIFNRLEDGAVVVIDDEFYRVYTKPEQIGDWVLRSEARHSTFSETGERVDGLGYCPVTAFYSNPISKANRVNNRGPITDVLGKLDWLLFWRTSKKYLDLYGAYPIIVSYKSACNYNDGKGNSCHEGFVDSFTFNGDVNTPARIACPKCSAKMEIGPGSWWEVDAPASKDEPDLLANPVKIVEISNDKLNYGVTEIIRLEDEVYLDSVGYDGEALGKQAVNETQVSANFESKKAVLDGIKEQFQRAHKFVAETMCRLRYADYFRNAVVDYGNDYFMKSAEDLTQEYKSAREAGMPVYYISTLRQQISRTRFRSNPKQLQRDAIMSALEPYADLSIDQLIAAQIPTLDPLGFIVKLNFDSFIARFEREQADVIQFGSLLPFGKKISIISQKLNDYGTAKIAAAGPRPQPGGNEGSSPTTVG